MTAEQANNIIELLTSIDKTLSHLPLGILILFVCFMFIYLLTNALK